MGGYASGRRRRNREHPLNKRLDSPEASSFLVKVPLVQGTKKQRRHLRQGVLREGVEKGKPSTDARYPEGVGDLLSDEGHHKLYIFYN